MRSKVNFGHPKWPMAAILLKFKKNTYRFEMASNVIESEFRTSKMADCSHFVKQNYIKNFKTKLMLHIDLKWPEMPSKVNFGHPKWVPAAILLKFKKNNNIPY